MGEHQQQRYTTKPSGPDNKTITITNHSSDCAPSYPKLQPDNVPPPPSSSHTDPWTSVYISSQPMSPPPELTHNATPPPPPLYSEEPRAPISAGTATTMPPESNPYVSPSPAPATASSSFKNKMDSVKDVFGKWGKKAAEATKKAEGIAGNMWQHLKTGPSFADAAVGRIAQGTKVLAEGGYEKIFRQNFETLPEEKLLKTYACYLSTSAGPVMGTLYLSTAKLAFCSESPLSYKAGDQTEWSYYKVVIPFHQLKVVNPSTSKVNPAEKYIQAISVDNHEFWFMGFVYYDSAVKYLQGVLQPHESS